MSACADLEDLFAHHRLLDAIIEEVDGRRIRIGERWLIDFASCNYLGLDLDREVIEAIPPSWTGGDPPELVADAGQPGPVPADRDPPHRAPGGGRLAAAADPDPHPRLGHPGAGLGRDREEISPYGRRGNGVVRHLGESYDHVVLTGGFSKAYSSLLAFVACPSELKRLLKITAPPYLYSGPSPVASLAGVLVGLQVNEARGDDLRAILWARTERILDHLDKLGAFTLNHSGFPIVEVPLATPMTSPGPGGSCSTGACTSPWPSTRACPARRVGSRIQVTAANTDDADTELLAALDRLADVVPLRQV